MATKLKPAGILIGAALLVAVFVLAELCWQQTLHNALPVPGTLRRTEVQGFVQTHHNSALVLGTGSMAPVIRSGKPTEIVAVALYETPGFDALERGDLVLFARQGQLIIHQLVQLDADGWITSGSHNSSYDAGRVREDNFRGRVTQLFNIEP